MPLEFKKSYATDISGHDGYITIWQRNCFEKEQIVSFTKHQFLELIKNAQVLIDEAYAEDEE